MSDLLQFSGIFLALAAIFIFAFAIWGLLVAFGHLLLGLGVLAFWVGKEMSLNRQKAEAEAYNRELMTGWSAEEIEDLERTDE